MRKILIVSLVLLAFCGAGCATGREAANQGPPGTCSAPAGEWMPKKGECPGTDAATQAKCDEFCAKHPDCCGERGSQNFGGREMILPLPAASQIARLKRTYPETIKALNEGPNIYSREGAPKIISEEKLEEIKAIGFNTVQVLFIGKKENGKLVFNEANNAVLLNDIIAIKNHGLAAWVALDIAGAPTAGPEKLGDYSEFKSSFLDFTRQAAALMEQYQVEYFTAGNEPDKPFFEQNWSAEEKNDNLADFLPAANAAAREKFSGKLINKITQPEKRASKALAASFLNVDIAGVDVGPPMDSRTTLSTYKEAFRAYQYYASLAEKANVPWMNAEYWQGDFDYEYNDFVRKNELTYAKISFDAYLQTNPKGAGYVWNDIRTFSLPQGEATKKALIDFFDKI